VLESRLIWLKLLNVFTALEMAQEMITEPSTGWRRRALGVRVNTHGSYLRSDGNISRINYHKIARILVHIAARRFSQESFMTRCFGCRPRSSRPLISRTRRNLQSLGVSALEREFATAAISRKCPALTPSGTASGRLRLARKNCISASAKFWLIETDNGDGAKSFHPRHLDTTGFRKPNFAVNDLVVTADEDRMTEAKEADRARGRGAEVSCSSAEASSTAHESAKSGNRSLRSGRGVAAALAMRSNSSRRRRLFPLS